MADWVWTYFPADGCLGRDTTGATLLMNCSGFGVLSEMVGVVVRLDFWDVEEGVEHERGCIVCIVVVTIRGSELSSLGISCRVVVVGFDLL